jgi:hypothetical protein
MWVTKTILATVAVAAGLLASPPAAAQPQRIPDPPPTVAHAKPHNWDEHGWQDHRLLLGAATSRPR